MPKFTYQNELKRECKELDTAIVRGNLAKVKELVNSQNINTGLDDLEHVPPIIAATAHAQFEIVKFLLEQKCSIDQECLNKNTALSSAIYSYAKYPHVDTYRKIALLLIHRGANVRHPCINHKESLLAINANNPLSIIIEKLRALSDSKEINSSPQNTFETYLALIVAYLNLNDTSKAHEYYLKAMTMSKNQDIKPAEVTYKVSQSLSQQHKELFNGMIALHGWGRKINCPEAIKTFERIAKTEESKNPDYAAFAYSLNATGHCQLASTSSEPSIKSERITRAIQAHLAILKIYSIQTTCIPSFDHLDQLFKLLAITDNENDKIAIIKTLLAYYQVEISFEKNTLDASKPAAPTPLPKNENIHKLSIQAEEKFNLKNHREAYRRLAEGLKMSHDEAMTIYRKAAELDDTEAALLAADIATQDESQIDIVIKNYDHALQLALTENNAKNIILTVKQILAVKDKFDLSMKQNARLDVIILSARDKLNDAAFIQPHFELLTTTYHLAKNTLSNEQISKCFATFQFIDNIKKITMGCNVVEKLLTEYANHSENKQENEHIHQALLQYVNDSITNQKPITEDLVHPLFKNYEDKPQIKQFTQYILPQIEQLLLEKEKTHLNAMRALSLFYGLKTQTMPVNETRTHTVIKLIDLSKTLYLKECINKNEQHGYFNTLKQLIANKDNPEILIAARNALNTIEYKTDQNKLKTRDLVKQDYLPAIYDLFEKYKKPRLLGKPHVRRPLYLAAKILLLTLNKKTAEKRFNLPKPKIDLMVLEANQLLTTWATKYIKDLKETDITHQMSCQAKWYLEIIKKAPKNEFLETDFYLLKATILDHDNLNITQIQTHVIEAMKRALKESDVWIQQKFDEIDATRDFSVCTESTPDNTTVQSTPIMQIKTSEASAPIEEISQPTKSSTASMYPILTVAAKSEEAAVPEILYPALNPIENTAKEDKSISNNASSSTGMAFFEKPSESKKIAVSEVKQQLILS